MVKIEFVEHNGKRILIQDFSRAKPGREFVEDLAKASKVIYAEPPKSVRLLLDFSQSIFTESSLQKLKEFAQGNTPYIRETSLVGITGLLQIASVEVSRASGRNYLIFDTREEALDYLASLE